MFPKWMALSNPLVFYAVLKLFTLLMPDVPFRLAFINGLMSESMVLWFGSMLIWEFCFKEALIKSTGQIGEQIF